MENSVKKVVNVTPVTVEKVYESEYQKEGTKTAQLRQTVTTDAYYPSKQPNNSMTDNVFDLEDFGFEAQKFTSEEKRVAWINVPEAASKEDVSGRIPENSVLYRILSNNMNWNPKRVSL